MNAEPQQSEVPQALCKGNHVAEVVSGFGLLEIGEVFYYLAFALYLLVSLLQKTTFQTVLGLEVDNFCNVVQFIILALLLAKLVQQKTTLLRWVIAVLLVMFGFATWKVSDEGWLFWAILFVVCGQKVRVRCLAAVSLAVTSIVFALVVACTQAGLIENILFSREGVVGARFSMGFSHPNNFGFTLLMICISFSTLRFGKKPVLDLVLILISAFLCIEVADSRTPALCLLITAILLIVFYLAGSEKSRSVLIIAFIVMVVLIVAASLYFMVAYDSSNAIHTALNSFLSTRLSLSHLYYLDRVPALFGHDYSDGTIVYFDGKPYTFVVDNAYCHVLLRYGILAAIIFVAALSLTILKAKEEQYWGVCLMGIVIFTICGFSETLGCRIECNFFLVAFSQLLYGGSLVELDRTLETPITTDGA